MIEGKGAMVSVLLAGEETAGRLAVIETRERRGATPPRHIHTREDEVVYVLEGRVRVYMDGRWLDCPAGSCVFLPRDREHTFTVASEEARLLVLLVPAGLEGYYRELGRPAEQGDGPSEDRRLDVERLVTITARYGVAITGPGC